jgi:hypothetical protein
LANCAVHPKKGVMKHSTVSLWLATTAVFAARLAAEAAPDGVPEHYRDLFAELQERLSAFEQQTAPPKTTALRPTVFAIELTAANANRGEALLAPRTRQGVGLNLDAFQALGAVGVTVATSFPILARDFPRSPEYLAFYKSVVEEVRRRGLRLHLKTGAAFVDPVFGHSPAGQFFQRLTPESYLRQKRQMVETILRELKPDYLTIDNEPDTTQKNTGLDYSPDRYLEYLRAVTKGLERGRTKIAAGAGTWSPLVYFERLAAEPGIDCIDLHVYPVNRDFLTGRVVAAAELARRHGKGLIVGEAWLYKVRGRELGSVDFSYPAIFGRDIFSFWAPLDARFITALGRWAQAQPAEFVSFFWAQHLFGYVDYVPKMEQVSPAELQQLGTRAAVPNIVARRPTASGEAFRRLATAPPVR